MFRLEPIYLFEEGGLKVWGYEVLFDSEVPNRLLFSVANEKLESYLFEKFREKLLKGEFPEGILTFNMSPQALFKNLERVLDVLRKFKNVYIELTEHGGNGSTEFPSEVRRRLILDDFLTRYSSFALLEFEPFGIKLEPQVLDAVNVEFLKEKASVLILEKVERKSDFERALSAGIRLFQGYLFAR